MDSAANRNSAKSAGAVDDRRGSPRVPQQGTFSIRPLLKDGVGTPIAVVLQDLSSCGLGALHSQPLHVGDQFQIPLTREALGESLTLICTVVRCEKLDEDLYSVGFKFDSSAAAIDEGSRQLTGKPARRSGSATN